MATEIYYFAYGSNLLPLRLAERVPSSQPLAPLSLPGHCLRWHKRGSDDSGKCDAYYTGREHDRLPGFVYRLVATERELLDRAEGLGAGYNLAYHNTDSELAGACRTVFFYQADPAHIDPALRPYDWYHALVVAGAQQHRLPASHIATLQQTAATADPDRNRTAQHQRLLRRARQATLEGGNCP